MQIVNICSSKKLTVSLLLIIFLFRVYLTSSGTAHSKKPIKAKTQSTRIGLYFTSALA